MTEDFRLEEWLVRPRRRLLVHGRERRRVSPKAMGVLRLLAERSGEVVSKDELVSGIWQEHVVSDEAVTSVVYELRRALGDDARHPRFIETIRKSGYRLVVPPEAVEGATTTTPGPRRQRWMVAAAGSALLTVALWVLLAPPVREHRAAEVRSLAVLPLASYITPDGELLATALTDMLSGDLAEVCPLEIAPTLTVRQRDAAWRLDQALEVLGADAVVEGGMARSSSRLWVVLQVVDTRSGRLLWSATYDRELGDELLVLREVAQDAALRIRDQLAESLR
jgi:adenylate cyclase